jgi:hypothetical protein
MREFYKEYHDKGVEVIGVTSFQGSMSNYGGERLTEISKEKELEMMPVFIEHQQVTWPIALSERGCFDPAYGVSGIPTLVIIDQEGIVRMITHPSKQQEIKTIVDSLLARK